MSKTNEATDTDLKVIEKLQQIGWPTARIKKRGIRYFINTMSYNYSI